jgi:hypothetical protein
MTGNGSSRPAFRYNGKALIEQQAGYPGGFIVHYGNGRIEHVFTAQEALARIRHQFQTDTPTGLFGLGEIEYRPARPLRSCIAPGGDWK